MDACGLLEESILVTREIEGRDRDPEWQFDISVPGHHTRGQDMRFKTIFHLSITQVITQYVHLLQRLHVFVKSSN